MRIKRGSPSKKDFSIQTRCRRSFSNPMCRLYKKSNEVIHFHFANVLQKDETMSDTRRNMLQFRSFALM